MPMAFPGLSDATVCLQCRWTREFGDREAQTEAHFIDSPSSVFTVTDVGTRDSADVGADLYARLRRSTSLRLHGSASFSAEQTIYIFGAALQWYW
jgi:uncharacterized protein with beta-barrel porin domain